MMSNWHATPGPLQLLADFGRYKTLPFQKPAIRGQEPDPPPSRTIPFGTHIQRQNVSLPGSARIYSSCCFLAVVDKRESKFQHQRADRRFEYCVALALWRPATRQPCRLKPGRSLAIQPS